MSKILIYLIHPNPKSLNSVTARSIEETLEENGHIVQFRDLYELNFNPLLSLEDYKHMSQGKVAEDVATEQEAILWAEGIVFVYPTWWWERPAMLKGFFDRVFTKGFAWDFGANGIEGKLQNKKILATITHGASKELYQNIGANLRTFHDSLKIGTFGFCGVKEIEVFSSFGIPMNASDEQVSHVKESSDFAKSYFSNDN